MAICSLQKNLLKTDTCSYTLNEVKDLYIANFNDITAAPVDYNCESGVTVSAITLATGAKFSHIEPARNSVTYTDELVTEDSGAKYRTHTVTFSLSGNYDKDMVCPVDALSLGRFFVVVKTAGGQYLVLGRAAGLEASEQSIAGGGDTNGITVTLTANAAETAVPLSSAAVESLLSNVY